LELEHLKDPTTDFRGHAAWILFLDICQPDGSCAIYRETQSLKTLLITTFQEKFHTIGWYTMCLGKISHKWKKAYALSTSA
jgi:hypothetical protein